MYEFTLKLNTDQFDEELANKLFDAGCSDALFNANANGVYLDFCREAISKQSAITSAIEDVKKAGYDAELQMENSSYAGF
ncbi:hypothetical protein FOG18_06205 [Legionella israelensis]|uniref:hypothetical protein n=1 Tax=Legionella israelensis TaxID=454 RepID=UPI00117E9EDA|nr:hypothetical protein [Legionella israelensis]QDP72183.1 hypothetical protein FOG18_06205 [Legionella israelensis]